MIINEEIFKLKRSKLPYWQKDYRWSYLSEVAKLVNAIDFKNSIEIGSEGMLIVDTSLNIESKNIFNLESKNWPFKTDLFIALQVFEHLNDKKNAFIEMKKCSKHAIISLPYNWKVPFNDCHYMIDEKMINDWSGYIPKKSIIKANRIINYYKFE